MYVELIKEMIFFQWIEPLGQYKNGKKLDFTEVNQEIEKLLRGAESCQEMINNRRNVSDEAFYSMLKDFVYIKGWGYDDCNNVIAMAYNIEAVDDDIISTTMHEVIHPYRNVDEEIGIDLEILYTKEFKIDYNHFYTVAEIKKLIAEKKIIILTSRGRDLDKKNNYKKENYKGFHEAYTFPVFLDYDVKQAFFNKNRKYYKYTLKYIRNQLNSRKLKKLYSEYFEHVKREIHSVTDYHGPNPAWVHVAKEYSKEFEERGYAKRLTRLKLKEEKK